MIITDMTEILSPMKGSEAHGELAQASLQYGSFNNRALNALMHFKCITPGSQNPSEI